MDLDPHTLQQIIEKIKQQLRCPQCGKKVPVEFSSLKFVGDGFIVFQLKCQTCDAFIMLHATVIGVPVPKGPLESSRNVSSSLHLDPKELEILRRALAESGGSFAKVFRRPPST